MMALQFATLLVFILYHQTASQQVPEDLQWKTLRVKFSPNPGQDNSFERMPLTRIQAIKEGYTPIEERARCAGQFEGYRYWKDGDWTIVLIYDINGYIAGVQNNFPESAMSSEVKSWFENQTMFDMTYLPTNRPELSTRPIRPPDEPRGIFRVLTAYFVDPSIICTTGRSRKEFEKARSGKDLYLKNGTEVEKITKNETTLQTTTQWTKGKCYNGMGTHYWYQTAIDMNCQYFHPVFLMYNQGLLTGFGWFAFGKFNSTHYEFPIKAWFPGIFDPVPDCLNAAADAGMGFSAQHVFFTVDPWKNLVCPE